LGCKEGKANVHFVRTWSNICLVIVFKGACTSVDFSYCGNYFSSGGDDSMVMIWKSNVYYVDEDGKII